MSPLVSAAKVFIADQYHVHSKGFVFNYLNDVDLSNIYSQGSNRMKVTSEKGIQGAKTLVVDGFGLGVA